MNDKRFLKVFLIILLASVSATANAAKATQPDQDLVPDPAIGSKSFESLTFPATVDGGISGAITDGSNPIENIEVTVFRHEGSYWTGVGWGYSDASGNYNIGTLPTGNYRVRFDDGGDVYSSEYYDDAPDLDSATDISVTGGSTTYGIDAVLVEWGHITGRVTDGTKPLQDIRVVVFHWKDSDFDWARLTFTDASGNYDVGNLPSGTYRVEYSDNAFIYLTEYYDDSPDLESATDISVTAGSTTSGVDTIMAEGGHITGTVTDGTYPLHDIRVEVYHWTGSEFEWLRSTYTDVSGNYDVVGLPSGTYRIRFNDLYDVYIGEYFDDAPDLESATDVSVTAGSITSGIDAVLTEWGHITGTVSGGTNPLPGIIVEVFHGTGDGSDWEKSTFTDGSGDYDFGGLPSGTYRVRFSDNSGIYFTEYFDDAPDLDNATLVSVTVGSITSGIDAILAEGGHISGTVSDGTNPLSEIDVTVFQWSGSAFDWLKGTGTDAAGKYIISGLSTGTYRVEFFSDFIYSIEYYDNAPDLESATDISVEAGSTTSGIDAVMVEWGHITGTVSNGTNPLPGIEIRAYRWTGSDYDGSNYAWTNETGKYDLGHLPSGTYRVEFSDFDEVYIPEFYDDAPNLESATDISVMAGSTTPDIDAVLVEWGHISGTVTDGTKPLTDVRVSAYRRIGSEFVWVNAGGTDTSGNYNLGLLPTGTFRVEFDDITGVYVTEYYDDVWYLDRATDISVTAGSTTSGIDAVLEEPEPVYLPSIIAK